MTDSKCLDYLLHGCRLPEEREQTFVRRPINHTKDAIVNNNENILYTGHEFRKHELLNWHQAPAMIWIVACKTGSLVAPFTNMV